MKIISVIGARPQFIKIAPLCKEISRHKRIRHLIIHTGQHYDYELSKIFFDEMAIPKPDYNLGIGSFTHGKQTALMLQGIEDVLLKERNVDLVIVFGDTNSTLAGALAAVKMGIPVIHAEAGLRSHRLDMPEEVNRILTDHISRMLLCPTQTAKRNLEKEGIKSGVYLTGDLMYEVFRDSLPLINKRKIIVDLGLKRKNYFLFTTHRQENTDNLDNLKSILSALSLSGEKIVFPVHPRTRKAMAGIGYPMRNNTGNLLFIKPVGYLDMLALEKNAKKIITDSGGVQKEAYWLGVKCITLRNETEWAETVEDGWNVLAGVDKNKIIKLIKKSEPEIKQKKFYLDPSISKNILNLLIENFSK